MLMKRINLAFGCVLLAFFSFMTYTARTTLEYWRSGSYVGPGAGFFPFWVSMTLVVLTLYWLIQVTVRPGEEMPKDFIPPRHERMLVLLVFGNMILFTAIMEFVGFPVAMFVFLLSTVVILGERTLRDMIASVVFSGTVTAFFVVVFGQWLEVAFPKSSIGILKALGL